MLVSDFYGAYNVYQGPHQRCWVHLLRAMHQLKERYPQEAAASRSQESGWPGGSMVVCVTCSARQRIPSSRKDRYVCSVPQEGCQLSPVIT